MNPEEIKKVIESEDDFGHEMRVWHELQKAAAFDVTKIYRPAHLAPPQHGETYIDPVTNKDRQFDFRCQIRFSDGTPTAQRYCVLMAIECKNLHPSSPLIMCGRERTHEEAYHAFVESKCDENKIPYDPMAKKVEHSRIYPANKFVGKSLVRLQPDGKANLKTIPQADIYDRWSQAVTSGKELAKDAGSFAKQYGCTKYLSFILPVVVVPNGSLWTAMYSNAGQIQDNPSPVNECEFFIAARLYFKPPKDSMFVLTHIHFVTLDGFAALLKRHLEQAERVQDWIFQMGNYLP